MLHGMMAPVDETRDEWKARIGVGEAVPGSRLHGSTYTTVVARDDKPGIAGTTTEHWDGRRDAVAMPETVRVKAKELLR